MEKHENKIQRFRIIYFKFKSSFNVLNTARNLKNIKTGKKDKRGIEMEKKNRRKYWRDGSEKTKN